MRSKENGASLINSPHSHRKETEMNNHISYRKPPLLRKVKHTRSSNASIARLLDVVSYGLSWLALVVIMGAVFAGVFE